MNSSRFSERLFTLRGLALPLCLIAAIPLANAQSLESHVHGEATLNLVSGDRQLQVEFISPAMNLLGFERGPASDEETESLNTVIQDLQSAEWLLGNAMANCEASTVAFEAPDYGPATHESEHEHEHEETEHQHEEHGHEGTEHQHEEHGHEGTEHQHEEHGHEGDEEHEDHAGPDTVAHTEFRVEYRYQCPEVPPRVIKVTAFDRYAGIEKITVQWVVGRQQGFAELIPNQPVLELQ